MRSIDTIHALSSLPATDGNFKSQLERATANQIRIAIGHMEQTGGKNKGRIDACRRELRKRDKDKETAYE